MLSDVADSVDVYLPPYAKCTFGFLCYQLDSLTARGVYTSWSNGTSFVVNTIAMNDSHEGYIALKYDNLAVYSFTRNV